MCSGVLTDVTLVAGDVSVPCHRLLLSANSDYFAAMFTGGMVEASLQAVSDIKYSLRTLRYMFEYRIYCSEIAIQKSFLIFEIC